MERMCAFLLLMKMVLNLQDRVEGLCCEPGWVEFKGICYYFSTSPAGSWQSARKYCLTRGADLTSIHSDDEKEFINDWMERINDAFGTAYFWNGANDRNQEGKFVWSDKTKFSYSNWWFREPNDSGGEHCVEMYTPSTHFGKWNDLKCNTPGHRYVCKKIR
uniref:Toxin candidate TRINITY_DN33449_c0_g1_i1.p1 n=1 Tax=Pachycerianthus maua TaxID=2736681 RepID=A0A7G7WYX4_9CNID|nr:toxin candidate TRINITY_DN33449_c0_g1_i1.p1 [Pachycerianthus maua]